MTEERKVEVAGRLQREKVDVGSKSAREAVVLKTNQGETYTVRLQDEPSFGTSALAKYVGLNVSTHGVASDTVLIVEDFHITE